MHYYRISIAACQLYYATLYYATENFFAKGIICCTFRMTMLYILYNKALPGYGRPLPGLLRRYAPRNDGGGKPGEQAGRRWLLPADTGGYAYAQYKHIRVRHKEHRL
jgi:hypothetical protein